MLKLERDRLLASTVLSGLAAGFLAAGTAFAQDAPPPATPAAEDIAADEEVVVTGTRVQRPGVASTSPIQTIGSQEIALQQVSEVEKILRTLPSTVPGDGANVNNGTAGAATVDLRSLGENRTLVLMDGKRMTPFDIQGIVDISQVPIALLERIDIVTGGASAVYGSDAVSGAVNFILKKDFEGVAVDTEFSISGKGDGQIITSTGTIGANLDDDRGNVTLTIGYTNRQPVQLSDRDFGIIGVESFSGSGLDVEVPPPVDNCGGTSTVPAGFGGSGTTLPSRVIIGTGATLQFRDDGTLSAPVCNQFNFNPFNYYQTPMERYQFLGTAEYDINENVTAYARAVFANTTVRQQIAPSGVFFNGFDVPMDNPFLGAQARNELITRYNGFLAANPDFTLADLGATDNNGNGLLDTSDDVNLLIGRRTVELGERSTTTESNVYQILVGLKGNFSENWDYDLYYSHGRSKRVQINGGYTNVANIALALDTVSSTTCTTRGGTTTPGCVPINLFGSEGTITPEMAAYARATALLDQVYTQDILSGSVSGIVPEITLPWATDSLSVAFGLEYRQEKGVTTPDECLKLPPVSCLGGAGGTTLPVSGGFDVYEMFAEAILPIVQDQPFFEQLTIEIGGRYSEYDPAGQNTTYKAGADWSPVEGLRFRAMFQRAVRAPNVFEIASPTGTGLDNATFDPCSNGNPNPIDAVLRDRCIATGVPAPLVGIVPDIIAGQINIFTGTDPLNRPDPEEADSLTLGVVFQPDFLGDAIVNPFISIDYYDIKVDGPIGSYLAQEILDGCYVEGVQSFCDLVVRENGNLVADGSGLVAYTRNLTELRAEGIEFNVAFGLDLDTVFGSENSGSLDFMWMANWYLTNEYQTTDFSDPVDCLGHYGPSCSDLVNEWRWNFRATYTYEDWQFSALWRHLSAATEEPGLGLFEDFQKIDAYDYLDLSISYQVIEEAEITLAASNIFDKDPPIIGNNTGPTDINGGNTFPSNYDTLGTIWSMGVNLRF